MKIINKNPYDLIEADYNPRELTETQYKSLSKSIEKFGLIDPLIININEERKDVLVGGHQRLKIAKALTLKTVPCVEVDLTLERERELNIRLNKNVGQWDYDALANHFDVSELTDWGFSEAELLWQGNYEPSFGNKQINEDGISAEQQKLDDHFKDRFEANIAKRIQVICPDCAYEFSVNELN